MTAPRCEECGEAARFEARTDGGWTPLCEGHASDEYTLGNDVRVIDEGEP